MINKSAQYILTRCKHCNVVPIILLKTILLVWQPVTSLSYLYFPLRFSPPWAHIIWTIFTKCGYFTVYWIQRDWKEYRWQIYPTEYGRAVHLYFWQHGRYLLWREVLRYQLFIHLPKIIDNPVFPWSFLRNNDNCTLPIICWVPSYHFSCNYFLFFYVMWPIVTHIVFALAEYIASAIDFLWQV